MASAQGCGGSSTDSLAAYDHESSSWRTSQLSLFGGLSEYLETWPSAGMTQSGIAYQRESLAPSITVTGSGLWPTPRREDYKGASSRGPCAIRRVQTGEANLPEAVQMETPGPLNPT